MSERLANALAGTYRIERELGAGGMATVYLAEDLKHRRKVAVKVLKPELAAALGAERFVQEITTTAALQHPNILPLFDSGEADGFLYYVMPFIDGETLRARLERETQLGVEEAVQIARDVADALQCAHSHGVIHRDIKPENVLLANGRPMVADFGIALAVSAAAGGRMTETGLSLGTPHYMSPEQATAEREITARSDVYSLGCVLYEMLAGSPPHTGASAQQIIMKIVTEDVPPVTNLRRTVPPNVSAAISRALEKLPADRMASAREFADALANPAFMTVSSRVAPARRIEGRSWLRDRRTLATFVVAALSLGASLAWGRRESSADDAAEVIRMVLDVDSTLGTMITNESSHGPPVVSPDGRSVAFAGMAGDNDQLLIRAFDRFEARSIPGGGRHPFYSPDGRRLGFARAGQIWQVGVVEGDPVPVGSFALESWIFTGACWTADGRILATTYTGLWSVPATGGVPSLIAAPDTVRGETFLNPVTMDEDRVMIEVRVVGRPTRLVVMSLATGERTPLPDVVVAPAATVADVIIFGQDPVRAVRFDRRTLALIGAPVPISGVPSEIGVSPAGSLAWFESTTQINEPVWVNPGGREEAIGLPPALYRWPRLSPGGTMIAHGLREAEPMGWLWTTSLRTGKRVRLGTTIGNTEPVWRGDTHVIFAGGEPPHAALLMQRADASQPPDTLYRGPLVPWPTDVSRDGTTLAFYANGGDEADDLFFLDLSNRAVRRVVRPGVQRGGRFSPDGRWFAYESLEGGDTEIHVQPWPALDARWVVSSGPGREPAWSRDSKQLLYRANGRVMAIDVPLDSSWEDSTPREAARGNWFSDLYGDQSWDVAADGRFLMLRVAGDSRVRVKVIRNWIAEFRATR